MRRYFVQCVPWAPPPCLCEQTCNFLGSIFMWSAHFSAVQLYFLIVYDRPWQNYTVSGVAELSEKFVFPLMSTICVPTIFFFTFFVARFLHCRYSDFLGVCIYFYTFLWACETRSLLEDGKVNPHGAETVRCVPSVEKLTLSATAPGAQLKWKWNAYVVGS